ncbi:pyruvate kinase, partial [Tanacetum coccineum]
MHYQTKMGVISMGMIMICAVSYVVQSRAVFRKATRRKADTTKETFSSIVLSMGSPASLLERRFGPVCCSYQELEKLALGGMNVARLNMCHDTREWHQDAIRNIMKKGTEGSQIHVVHHGAPSSVKAE